MELAIHEINNKKIAEVISDDVVIKDVQDALDLMFESDAMGTMKIILLEKHLSHQFFDLKTQLAGDILQKFSNYDFKLAIVRDFSKY